MKNSAAEIVREYGPFPGVEAVHGLSYDGRDVWFASGNKLNVLDPASGKTTRTIDITANAGTAFDGKHLYQIAEGCIRKLNPENGEVLHSIPVPADGVSGLAWAEGSLWVGEYKARKIHQVDPYTGAVLRSIDSNRYVTGVSWVDGELWHGTWENEQSELRQLNPETGEVVQSVEMPSGTFISGLESNGKGQFFCGGGPSGKIRAVKRPAKA